MFNLTRPSSLQGNFGQKKYFEGWFHKIYSTKYSASFIVIYGYTTGNTTDKFGFIQVQIPNKQPLIMYFNKNEVFCDPNKHNVRMGKHIFTANNIDIITKDITIQLHLSNNQPIQTFKNSMGYHYLIPNLPCYHAILNKSHTVSGEIHHENSDFFIEKEMGYLEKNWGTSFPKNYFWLHAFEPKNSKINLLFSQAEIKWIGKTFLRHIGYFCFDDEFVDFRQLTKCVVSNTIVSPEKQLIRILSKSIELEIFITLGKQVLFKGPEDGILERDIIHYTDAIIEVNLKSNTKTKQFSLVGNFENIQVKNN